MKSFFEKAQVINEYSAHTSFPQKKILSQAQSVSAASTIESLSRKETSVEMSISYQVQPEGLSAIALSCDFSQQALNGSVAIGTVMAITFLIRAITPLIKACRT